METLNKQYRLIRGSREVVLDYLESMNFDDLKKTAEGFNKATILYFILHIANTYQFWLKSFIYGTEFKYFDEKTIKNVSDIRKAFDEVNLLVFKFLNKFNDRNTKIEGEIFWLKTKRTYSVLELFTHVTTHEFHHKGQIMTMIRVLGYTPPDADIIRFS